MSDGMQASGHERTARRSRRKRGHVEGILAPPFVERYGLAAVLFVVALGVAIRIPGMGGWWLNPDEGIYFSAAKAPTAAAFWADVARNSHPPLYYLILRAVGFLTTDFLWFRSISLVGAALAIFFFWRCARELAPERELRSVVAGLVAALLLVFSPMVIAQSQVMRQYTLQLALLAGALSFLLRYGRAPARDALAWYVGLLCLALLVHYGSMLAMGAFGGVALYFLARGGMSLQDGRELVLAHVLPVVVVVGQYFFHLRKLAASSLARNAFQGWLHSYMVHSPRTAWLAFVGLQTLVLGRRMGGLVTVLMVGALVLAVVRRQWLPLVLAGSALVVGVAAAALGEYPMGSTRHSLWMLVFTVPVLGWATAVILTSGRRQALAFAAAVAVLAVAPVGVAVGVLSTPWAPAERVLKRSDLLKVSSVVDPDARPRLEIMDQQTQYLLMPFFWKEQASAVDGPSDTFSYFAYGSREIVVAHSWALTTRADGTDVRGNLRALLSRVRLAAPRRLGMTSAKRVQVVVGGWPTEAVAGLLALADSGVVVSDKLVPGLSTFIVDPHGLARSHDARLGPSTPQPRR